MDKVLAESAYLAGEDITLADIACYTYTAHVPEGGVSLDAFPNIRSWLERIEEQPRFVGMARSPVAVG